METTQHILTQRRVAMQQVLPKYVAETAAFDVIESAIFPELLLRLKAFVLTDQYQNGTTGVTLDVPATWWQHFKRDRMPVRLRRRWPVRLSTMAITVHCEHFRLFPEADVTPPQFGRQVIYESVKPSEFGWHPKEEL